MPKYEYLSHDDMDRYYAEAVRQMAIEEFKPAVVIAPMRGGADFGIKVSNYFDIPFIPLQWQTRDGTEQDRAALTDIFRKYDGQKILFVDDICDSGETLIGIASNVGFSRNNSRFAVAIENIESCIGVEYSGREISRSDDTQWFVFPWENWWKR